MGKWGNEVLLARGAAPAFPPAPRPSFGGGGPRTASTGFCVCPRGLPPLTSASQGLGAGESRRSCWTRTWGGCQWAGGQDPAAGPHEAGSGLQGQEGQAGQARVCHGGWVVAISAFYTFILLW